MDNIITALSTQVPDLIVLLFIVITFIKYLEKRDATYLQLVNQINNALQELTKEIRIHSIETADGMEEMRRRSAERRKKYSK